MEAFDCIEWEILDALSVDDESLTQVSKTVDGATRMEVATRLAKLVAAGFVSTPMGAHFDPDRLLVEPEADFDPQFWFELTQQGSAAWEAHAEECSGEPIAWAAAYAAHIDYHLLSGSVTAASEETCRSIMLGLSLWSEGYALDEASIQYREAQEWYPYYHRRLIGGHRVDFEFTQGSTDAD